MVLWLNSTANAELPQAFQVAIIGKLWRDTLNLHNIVFDEQVRLLAGASSIPHLRFATGAVQAVSPELADYIR